MDVIAEDREVDDSKAAIFRALKRPPEAFEEVLATKAPDARAQPEGEMKRLTRLEAGPARVSDLA
jgi:hypothetical protein